MRHWIVALLTLCSATAVYADGGDRLVGADISLLPSYEAASTPYYSPVGKRISDLVPYLRDDAGMNAMRVRLFVNPTETGTAKTGVVQDLEYVMKLGRRIKAAGMKLLITMHYSDSWADPAKQTIPSGWATTDAALVDSMYSYTKRCMQYLVDNDAAPDYVQVGNEVSYGMLWRSNSDKCYTTSSQTASSAQWTRFAKLLNSGIKAVREVVPEAQIVIHSERAASASQTVNFYKFLNTNKVDYDVIGLSYYPFWHNSLSVLSATLNQLASYYPTKKVQIVETAYNYQYYAADATYDFQSTWPATEEGQKTYVQDLVAELQKHSNVNGVYWWFAEENGSGNKATVISSWLNRGLFHNSTHRALSALFELKAFRGGDGDDTPVDAVLVDGASDDVYDLMGRKMSGVPAKGIYIRNGKKFVNLH